MKLIWEIKQILPFEVEFVYILYYSSISLKSNNWIPKKFNSSGILYMILQLKLTYGQFLVEKLGYYQKSEDTPMSVSFL